MTLETDELLRIDQQHIWHPYARAEGAAANFPVASASGVHLTLCSGERLLDGMSSWWSAIHGYNHPTLNQALLEQSQQMAHVMFGGLTHAPAAQLAKRLVEITPPGLNRVFFCDSGSVAVEVAMKLAVQFWSARKQQRHRFLSLRQGYHGDTIGAMSVCDPVTGMHSLFRGFINDNLFAAAPDCAFDHPWQAQHFDDFAHLATKHQQEIAAVILEPIVQGAGGMRFYSPVFLQQVRQLCDELGLLLIADEIATGFGRSGKLFACEHAAISPDILCLGKALSGGYMSFAATLCSDAVAITVCQSEAGVFMHGPTFMGNPLACAVSLASIDLLFANDWQRQVNTIEKWLRQGLAAAVDLPAVKQVRVLGAIGVIELHQPVAMATIQPMMVAHGIWLRPFGRLIYTMPPYICRETEIAFLCQQALEVISQGIDARR